MLVSFWTVSEEKFSEVRLIRVLRPSLLGCSTKFSCEDIHSNRAWPQKALRKACILVAEALGNQKRQSITTGTPWSANIQTSEAAPVKSRRSPARATNADRATTPRLWLVSRSYCSSVLTSYSRYSDTNNIVPHITKTKRALLVTAHPHGLFGVGCSEKIRDRTSGMT